jgi:hypothetical protein
MSEKCPLCDDEIHDDNYPRYRIQLEDESHTESNCLSEDRLCSRCWETLSLSLSGSLILY